MAGKGRWIAVIVFGTFVAGIAGPNGPLGGFWGVEESDTEPAGGALAGLIGAAVIEGIAFGVGLAWLAFGWRYVKKVQVPLAFATYLLVGWGLVSWTIHSSFHQSITDDNYGGLAAIEWGFHVTAIISACVIAAFVWQVLARSAVPERTPLGASA